LSISNQIGSLELNNKLTHSLSQNSYQISAMNHEKRNSTASFNNISYGGSDRCVRCSKPVYAAEKTVAAGKVLSIFFYNNIKFMRNLHTN
jgi:hypothetical protein